MKRYAARRTGDIVQLEDSEHRMIVSVVPPAGNITSGFNVNGQNVLHSNGIPFLAPWANRLSEQAFYANGKRYPLDMQLGRMDGAFPIHGFLSDTDQWQMMETRVDDTSAWVTSKLEFYRQPMWMKQFPFAHTIEMTHRLQEGVLQVKTSIMNLGTEPMPVAVGFHPYYQLTDSPRAQWTISLPAKTRWLLSGATIPTGETEPAENIFPGGRGTLGDYNLDDVFSDLVRDAEGRATVAVKGKGQQLDVMLSPAFRSLVIYSPNPADFICIEPMAGITDAMNLAQKGLYKEQQYVAPNQTWDASFWIKPTGF